MSVTIIQNGKVVEGESLDDWFEDAKPGDLIDPRVGPFEVQCVVHVNRPPRHDAFEWDIERGRGSIDDIFAGQHLQRERVFFCFPERWMTPQEKREFMAFLRANPATLDGTLKQVVLFTQSPIIIGEIASQQIRIVENPEEHPHKRPFYAAVKANEAKRREALGWKNLEEV